MGRQPGKSRKPRKVHRFSLPSDKIYYNSMLSRLGTKGIAHLSTLSEKLEGLKLDKIEEAGAWPSFTGFLKKLPNLREVGTEMTHSDEGRCIRKLICRAAQRQLPITRELDMDFKPEEGKALELPHCGALRDDSELNLHNGRFQLPAEGFDSLRLLSLTSVHIVCDSLGEFVSSCKFLKKLNLQNFSGIDKLKITSSSLEDIIIVKLGTDDFHGIDVSAGGLRSIYVAWFFLSGTNKVFNLSAPSLQSLNWIGDTVNHCHLGKLPSLQNACINLRHPSRLTQNLSRTEEASMYGCLGDVVCSISAARTLQLNNWHVEIFAQNRRPFSLDNLQELVVNVFHPNKDDQLPALVSFLKLLPNLKTLVFRCCCQPWGPNISSKPKENSTLICSLMGEKNQNQLFIHLESVEIRLTEGEKEIELVKYLLEHAQALKQMTVSCTSIDDVQKVRGIAKAIEGFKKDSSNASLLLI